MREVGEEHDEDHVSDWPLLGRNGSTLVPGISKLYQLVPRPLALHRRELGRSREPPRLSGGVVYGERKRREAPALLPSRSGHGVLGAEQSSAVAGSRDKMRDRSSVWGRARYVIAYLEGTYALIRRSAHALAGSHDAGS